MLSEFLEEFQQSYACLPTHEKRALFNKQRYSSCCLQAVANAFGWMVRTSGPCEHEAHCAAIKHPRLTQAFCPTGCCLAGCLAGGLPGAARCLLGCRIFYSCFPKHNVDPMRPNLVTRLLHRRFGPNSALFFHLFLASAQPSNIHADNVPNPTVNLRCGLTIVISGFTG